MWRAKGCILYHEADTKLKGRVHFSLWHAALAVIFILLIVASDEYRCTWHIMLRSIDVRSHTLADGGQILQIMRAAEVLINVYTFEYICF